MNTQNEPQLRTLLLKLLYEKRHEKYPYVMPENFSPPWSKKNIFYFGREFHEANIIKEFPLDDGRGGYFMEISSDGKAIWEKRKRSSLDFEGLP